MSRPCDHAWQDTPEPGCQVCHLYFTDPSYRALWDGAPPQPAPMQHPLCPHLGEPTGELRECGSCGGKTKLKVFACRHPAREPDQVTITQDCASCVYRPRLVQPDTRALILKNHLSPGDVLAMTAAVYSLHKQHPGQFLTQVDTTCPAVWEHNPDIATAEQMASAAPATILEMHYPLINESNQRGVHFLQGYCDYLEEKLQVRVPLLTNRPHVYVSSREKTWMSQVQEITGRPTRYWVVNAGVKQDYTLKQWPHYQEVVDRLQGQVVFVQVGKAEHLHRPLRGVIDLLGKTDDRQLVRLIHHCSGVLCGTTFTMHLAAALQKPAVVLAGGREPVQWNAYPLQQTFSSVGAYDCCRTDACWRSRAVPLHDGGEQDQSLCEQPAFTDPPSGRCMAAISPAEVVAAILRYCS